MKWKAVIGFVLMVMLTTLNESCEPSPEKVYPLGTYLPVVAFPNISFTRPVDLQNAGDDSNRLFVVEQRGVISVFDNDPEATTKKTFLDLQGKVDDAGNEEGLLGLAFHPKFKTNGQFFVNYTAKNPNRTVIARYTVDSSDPDKADPLSGEVILEYEQPYSNHNGGQLAFGSDGFLYIAVGDGGSGGDPQGNGQNRATLLGAILRIDINKTSGDKAYAIPSSNPFAGNKDGVREEIFAYGLRNPWRFSFDKKSGKLWAADVGQGDYEEIDIITKGKNYGWNIMEGTHCYSPATDCDQTGLELPIIDYSHADGRSITGGFVYRGSKLKGLVGKYVYADYVTKKVWALDVSDLNEPITAFLFDTDFNIPSFGVDEDQEIYILGFDGKIYKMEEQED